MTDLADPASTTRQPLPFALDRSIAARAALGLIVLATDQTIEHEFRRLLDLPGVALYQSRILNDNAITPATLKAMEGRLVAATEVILPGLPLDVVAFGCTSASMVLGEAAVAQAIHAARPEARATNPITAAFAAFDAFGARRIAVLTPYRRDVNEIVRSYITGRGYEVPVFGSFNEQDDGVVANIDRESLRAAVRSIVEGRDVDAVFVSCTSVRLLDAVCEIESECGLPVTSSNHAMAWHCLRRAGVEDRRPDLGRLFGL
jgi:maleate isomerase